MGLLSTYDHRNRTRYWTGNNMVIVWKRYRNEVNRVRTIAWSGNDSCSCGTILTNNYNVKYMQSSVLSTAEQIAFKKDRTNASDRCPLQTKPPPVQVSPDRRPLGRLSGQSPLFDVGLTEKKLSRVSAKSFERLHSTDMWHRLWAVGLV